ncbi:MAG: ribosomal protein S18-alanine N-acetyltransferase [Candidatus Hydrogenedentes bacterium]|jgi:ribosomal-protein-alanine N-acetyltransferase|nr:ribosomal protein S18-alanine N-acetyltransferase [Candidatus Hydrogenedentota bacterium]
MPSKDISELRFSPLQLEDIPFLVLMEGASYPDPWTYNMFRQEIDGPISYFCVVFQNDQRIGYGGFWLLFDEAHITRVTITLEMRGRQFGMRLMNHLLDEARKRSAHVARLEVRESNQTAITLYERLGFFREGVRKGYYAQTNENAIVMSKKFKIGS